MRISGIYVRRIKDNQVELYVRTGTGRKILALTDIPIDSNDSAFFNLESVNHFDRASEDIEREISSIIGDKTIKIEDHTEQLKFPITGRTRASGVE